VTGYRVDLRSDTVTTPSPRMRRAMADADVGDDWYGDDPTVNRLQESAAEALGTEAAIYLPTGTMANQIGLRLHVSGAGHLLVSEELAHVATTEVMSSAVLSGIAFRTFRAPRGLATVELVSSSLEPDSYYDVEVVDLLALENTVGGHGGTVQSLEELQAIRKVAEAAEVPVHLDGARIFNAAVASGVPASEYAACAETIMFCVSKGLGAPIGSLLCGPAALMPEARRLKILFGGAWRQAGVLAAAGLIALEEGAGRLHEDHARARRLGEGIHEVLPHAVDLEQVQTNMVLVDTESYGTPPIQAVFRMRDDGIGATIAGGKVRMLTHVDVNDGGIQLALDWWRRFARESDWPEET
jgi:threonine aldolase